MIRLSGTLMERLDEALRLTNTGVSEESLDRFRRVYDIAQIPLLPSALDFYKAYGGVFREQYLVLRDAIYNGEVFFTFYADLTASQGSAEEALRRLDLAMDDMDEVRKFAKQAVCPVADIGYYYPAAVYVGENGLLYCVYEFQDEIEVFRSPSEIFESYLKGNVPVGIDSKPIKRYIPDEYKIETDVFMLKLEPVVHERDLREAVNTSLMIHVSSYDFSAKTMLDIDVRGLAGFAAGLLALYEELSGSVRLRVPYADECYVEFSADRLGHIRISGVLDNGNRFGFTQKLQFQNEIDQTSLREFAKGLYAGFGKYAGQKNAP